MNPSDDPTKEILANGPSSSTRFLVLSRLKREGRRKWVIQECMKALKEDPGAVRIRKLLSETLFEEGLVTQAEAELERVVREIEGLVSLCRLGAQVFAKQKRNAEAVSLLERYLAHHPGDEEALDLIEGLRPPATPPAEPPAPPPEEDREDMADLSTPTLAEVYFRQGQIREAVRIYEKVVARNPEEPQYAERLEALRAMVPPEPAPQDGLGEEEREKNRRMIALLESWLANIRKGSGASPTA